MVLEITNFSERRLEETNDCHICNIRGSSRVRICKYETKSLNKLIQVDSQQLTVVKLYEEKPTRSIKITDKHLQSLQEICSS